MTGKISLILGPRAGGSSPIPPGEITVHNAAELQAALAVATAAGGNTVIQVADGGEAEYGAANTVLNLKNFAPAQEVIIRGQNYRTATLPRITLENCNNISITRLKVGGVRDGSPGGVISIINTNNIKVYDNEIYGDALADQFFGGSFRVESVSGTFQEGEQVVVELSGTPTGGSAFYHIVPGVSTATNFVVSGSASDYKAGNGTGTWSGTDADRWYDAATPRTLRGVTSGATALIREKTSNVEFLVGVYSSATQPSNNVAITDNYIHDTKRGIGISGYNGYIWGNRIEHSYNAPVDLSGDYSNTIASANRCIDVWAQSTDGEPAGTNGPHSSLWGLSGTWRFVRGLVMRGNISLVGRARADAGWGQAFATGPKNNDQESTKSITLSGTSGAVNSGSATWQMMPGTRLIGPGVADHTVVTAVTSGVGGAGTTFTFEPAQTVGPVTMYVQGRLEWDCQGNIWDSNGAIGVEWDYLTATSVFKYNLLFSTRDTRLAVPTIPQLYLANIDGGAASHNTILQPALGDDSRYINEQFYRDSYDNVSLVMAATSGPASYEANFEGLGGATPFSGATLENILEMITPKAGSAAEGRSPLNAWDFDTDTWLNPPDDPAPITALSTGVDMAMVGFAGATAMRWTVAGAENLIDISDPNVFTQVWYIDPTGSDANANLSTSGPTGSDVYIRRLPTSSDNRLRFILKDSAGLTQQIDTIFTLSAADTGKVLALSIDFANYKICVWKGATMDPFPSVSAWSGLPMRVTANTLTVMGSEASTPAALMSGNLGCYAAHDAFLDGSDPAVHTKLVALDGKPADWGSDGALLFGETPRVFLAGDAAAWNDPAGLNRGTAVGLNKFQKLGTDVVNV